MTTTPYPDEINEKNLLESVREMSRLRETEDVSDFNNLPERFVSGRGLFTSRAAPSSSSDVLAADEKGDLVNDGTYEYKLLELSGTLSWDRRLLDTAWAAPSAGAFTLISATTISSDANLDFDVSGSFGSFEFEFLNYRPGTDGPELRLLYSDDNGLTFEEDIGDYGWHRSRPTDGAATYSGDNVDATAGVNQRIARNTGTDTGNAVSGKISVHDPSDTSAYKLVTGHLTNYDTDGNMRLNVISGVLITTSAITDVRIISSSGNLGTGTLLFRGSNLS